MNQNHGSPLALFASGRITPAALVPEVYSGGMGFPAISLPQADQLAEWLSATVKIYQAIRQRLQRSAHEGLYEVLAYEAELELLDKRGAVARFKKRQRVRFLQDYVIAFQDYAWGQGQVLEDYRCAPGQVVDRWQEGDRQTVLISLRETKQSGDVEEFYIERTIRRGFTRRDEWWQIEMQHQTRWLRFTLIFPKGRGCRRVELVEHQRSRTAPLDPRRLVPLPDGRQVFTWEIAQPRRFETYTFTWTW